MAKTIEWTVGVNAGAAIAGFSAIGMAAYNMGMRAFAGIKRAVLAIPDAVKDAITSADTSYKQAQIAGMGVEDFTRLKHAADLAGISAEDLQTAARQVAKKYHVDLLPALLKTAEQFATIGKQSDKLAIVQDRFSRSGTKLMPLLNQGAQSIRDTMAEADRLGIVVTEQFGKGAEDFNDTLTRINASFRGMAMVLAQEVLPKLQEMADLVLDTVNADGMKRIASLALALGVSKEGMFIASKGAQAVDDLGIIDMLQSMMLAESPYGPITAKQEAQFNARRARTRARLAASGVAGAGEDESGTRRKFSLESEKESLEFTSRGFLTTGEAMMTSRQLGYARQMTYFLESIERLSSRYLPLLDTAKEEL